MVRFKNRWLLVKLIPIGWSVPAFPSLEGKHIWAALKQTVINNFGDSGWGSVSLSLTVKYYSPTTNICIIRVARDYHKMAWSALTLLTTIEGATYIPRVIHLSGTIRHAQKAAITHNREIMAQYRTQAQTSDSISYLKKSIIEIEALRD